MSVSGYSGRQIGLHWAIAALFVVQFFMHDGIEASWRAFSRGETVEFSATTLGHIVVGIVVLLLLLPRVYLRFTRGVPPKPENETPMQTRVAQLTHVVLYGLMLLMPVSGLAAWFGEVELAAVAHSLMSNLVLLFVALHVAGALYHRFILRSDVMQRMTKAAD